MQLWYCFCARKPAWHHCSGDARTNPPEVKPQSLQFPPCCNAAVASGQLRLLRLLAPSCRIDARLSPHCHPHAGDSIRPFSAAQGITELSWGKPWVSSALQLCSALSCILSASSLYHRSPLSTHSASKLGQMLSCFSAGLFSSLHGTASTGLVESKPASPSLPR